MLIFAIKITKSSFFYFFLLKFLNCFKLSNWGKVTRINKLVLMVIFVWIFLLIYFDSFSTISICKSSSFISLFMLPSMSYLISLDLVFGSLKLQLSIFYIDLLVHCLFTCQIHLKQLIYFIFSWIFATPKPFLIYLRFEFYPLRNAHLSTETFICPLFSSSYYDHF